MTDDLEDIVPPRYLTIVRDHLWHVLPCWCDDAYRDRDMEQPDCSAHDVNRELGGDGKGGLYDPAEVAASLKAIYEKLNLPCPSTRNGVKCDLMLGHTILHLNNTMGNVWLADSVTGNQ